MLLVHRAGGPAWGGRRDTPEGETFKSLEDAQNYASEESGRHLEDIYYVSDNSQDRPEYIFYQGYQLYTFGFVPAQKDWKEELEALQVEETRLRIKKLGLEISLLQDQNLKALGSEGEWRIIQ
jgi:hypothetical protein